MTVGGLGDGAVLTRCRIRMLSVVVVVLLPVAGVAVVDAPPATAGSNLVLSAGGAHTCALLVSDQVECWGDNAYGELGIGSTTSSTVPVGVTGLPPATQVATGLFHTCALDVTGAAWCWGANFFGELGNAKNTDKDKPVAVATSLRFSQITAGGIESAEPGDFTCAVSTTRGSVYCWGWNNVGQLGTGATVSSNVPALVTGLPKPAVQVWPAPCMPAPCSLTAACGAGGTTGTGNWATTPPSPARSRWRP